ncbi:MAG TPA: CBS domain-containing protein [Xanthomonadales bacterium]|nr:CBS domain-containing protein [Xanthomonadales bacterium]
MTKLMNLTLICALCLVDSIALAEDVKLPAPVLQWSFYIFLIFAAAVGIGIFFIRTKHDTADEAVSNLIGEPMMDVHSVSPGVSVHECVRKMTDNRIGAMLVMEGDRLLGIFTERDCLTRVVAAGLDPVKTSVSDVMTEDPLCVPPGLTLDEAMRIITQQRFRHLPVAEDGKVLGMVSSGDLTHRLVADRSVDVRELVETAARRRASL